jgi:hypothetical protein
MPQHAAFRKAPTVAKRSPNGGLLLHHARTNLAKLGFIRAVYYATSFESQWPGELILNRRKRECIPLHQQAHATRRRHQLAFLPPSHSPSDLRLLPF